MPKCNRSEPPPWYQNALVCTVDPNIWMIWYPIHKKGSRAELVSFLWAWHDQIMAVTEDGVLDRLEKYRDS